jgi:hypothetical protein
MSPLFGSKSEKNAQLDAASAEIGRLCALPTRELAVEVLPAFGRDGAGSLVKPDARAIAKWLMAGHPRHPSLLALAAPIEESCQVLEQAGLLRREVYKAGDSRFVLTRLGHAALTEGTVRHYLPEQTVVTTPPASGHSDVPPEVVALAQAGKRANAIKRYQQLTGADLKHAFTVVDSL